MTVQKSIESLSHILYGDHPNERDGLYDWETDPIHEDTSYKALNAEEREEALKKAYALLKEAKGLLASTVVRRFNFYSNKGG